MGLALGLANGFGIGILKIPFFVVTLGTLSIYQSVALLTTKGETVSLFAYPTFNRVQTLINGNVGQIPTVLLLAGALYLIGDVRPALHGLRTRHLRGRLEPRGGAPDRHQRDRDHGRGVRDRGALGRLRRPSSRPAA